MRLWTQLQQKQQTSCPNAAGVDGVVQCSSALPGVCCQAAGQWQGSGRAVAGVSTATGSLVPGTCLLYVIGFEYLAWATAAIATRTDVI